MKLSIIGAGYVGLSLAILFARRGLNVFAYDISINRIEALRSGIDSNGEVQPSRILELETLHFTADPADLRESDCIIIAVQTDVDKFNRPDYTNIRAACSVAGQHLRKGGFVVIESMTHPGCTDKVLTPIIESSADRNVRVAYSPQRAVFGDQYHAIPEIKKIVAANDPPTLSEAVELYRLIVGSVEPVTSIETAEAANIVELVQKSVNQALMNDLSKLFKAAEISFQKTLEAASTRWDFAPYYPTIEESGGAIASAYLNYWAETQLGSSNLFTSVSSQINHGMGAYIVQNMYKTCTNFVDPKRTPTVLICGVSCRRDVRDVRGSHSFEIIQGFADRGAAVDVVDPLFEDREIQAMLGSRGIRASVIEWDYLIESWKDYDAVVLAAPHQVFIENCFFFNLPLKKLNGTLIDIEGAAWLAAANDAAKLAPNYWSL